MSQPALTATEMMAWVDRTSEGWHSLIAAHPEALAIPCDVMGVSTVGGLLQHIVAVELRYAEQLNGLPPTDYAAISFNSADAIYTTHQRASELLRQRLESGVDWEEKIEFVTRSMGSARASRKTLLFHSLLHSVRHYAQLATLMRQHGIKPNWQMDYLLMGLEPASKGTQL
jgi:uncharacterized damage-inducible protein DinB